MFWSVKHPDRILHFPRDFLGGRGAENKHLQTEPWSSEIFEHTLSYNEADFVI